MWLLNINEFWSLWPIRRESIVKLKLEFGFWWSLVFSASCCMYGSV